MLRRRRVPTPFFVCGFGKSGTNWVGNLLNLHPEISCDGEFHFQHFRNALDEFVKYPWQLGNKDPVKSIAGAAIERLIRECLASLAADNPRVKFVGDRSPRPLQELIQGAKTIYVHRDGRDVVVSYTFHHLRVGEAHHFPEKLKESFERHQREFRENPGALSFDRPGLFGDEVWIRETARFWAWRVQEDLKHGAAVESPTLLRVRYEDVHADVRGQARRMYQFLGAEPSLASAPGELTRTTPGFGREDRRSFFRKGEVGDWRRFANDQCRRWMLEEAGEALELLGYSWDEH